MHMVQLMPLPLHHICFSKIQNGLSLWYQPRPVRLQTQLNCLVVTSHSHADFKLKTNQSRPAVLLDTLKIWPYSGFQSGFPLCHHGMRNLVLLLLSQQSPGILPPLICASRNGRSRCFPMSSAINGHLAATTHNSAYWLQQQR